MKITTDCINHNVFLLIDDNSIPLECADPKDEYDHQRLVTSGYIRGVLDLAKALKEVLKA